MGIQNQDEIIAIENVPQFSVGAPLPVTISDEYNLLILSIGVPHTQLGSDHANPLQTQTLFLKKRCY